MSNYSIPPLPVLDIGRKHVRTTVLPSLLDMPHQLLTQGRNAIWWALQLSGAGAGTGVLFPSYHCPTMIAPAVSLGAQAHYYDIRPDGTPDLETINIPAGLASIRAMLVVHYFGFPLDLEPARQFCDRHNIRLIEDCSHAFFGAGVRGAVGRLGDYAIGSIPKFFPAPEGGVLASARQPLQIAEHVAERNAKTTARDLYNIVDNARIYDRLGWLSPLGALLATAKSARGRAPVADGSLPASKPASPATYADVFDASTTSTGVSRVTRKLLSAVNPGLDARRANFAALSLALSGVAACRPLRGDLPADAAPYVFPLWIDGDAAIVAKDLRSMGIPCYQWNELWPGTPLDNHPVARAWSHHVIQLPCHQSIRKADIEKMCAAILHCIGRDT